MGKQDHEINTMLCKHRFDCSHAYFNECPFGGPLETLTKAELDDPKSVCRQFELEDKNERI